MSDTGVGGLTLGGGIGWLMRRHGLTVDNLLSAEVVTADGRRLTASQRENAELFWGLRGGGGGLGVVASFTFRLHPVGPEVLAGMVVWSLDDAPDVLAHYREVVATAPRELSTVVVLRRTPPAPKLPVELHHRPVCVVGMLALGDGDRAERLLHPLRSFGTPLIDLVRLRPYTDLQSMFDGSAPAGWHYYWKSAGLGALDDDVIDTLVQATSCVESPASYSILFHLGGAVAEAHPASTAHSRRHVVHELNINAVWKPHETMGEREREWARRLSDELEPHRRGTYVNFLDHDDRHREADAFTPDALRRLVALRRQFDPDAVFG